MCIPRDAFCLQIYNLLTVTFAKNAKFHNKSKVFGEFCFEFCQRSDCFLFCNLDGALLKREDLLKFVFFFEIAYLKIMSCAQCYCIWHFLVTNFILQAFLVTFNPNIYFAKNNSVISNWSWDWYTYSLIWVRATPFDIFLNVELYF